MGIATVTAVLLLNRDTHISMHSTITFPRALAFRPLSATVIIRNLRQILRAAFSLRICIVVCAAAVASLFWQELTEQPVSPSLLLALPWATVLTWREERPAKKGGEL